MKDYEFHVDAEFEYVRAGEFYAETDREIGRRFFDEIERLIVDIRKNPLRFRFYDGAVRRHFSDTVPYAVLYLDYSDKIVIVSDAHEARARILALACEIKTVLRSRAGFPFGQRKKAAIRS